MRKLVALIATVMLSLFFIGCPPEPEPENENLDTSWYSDDKNEFILKTAAEFRGLKRLIWRRKNFSGKTIKLGADIMLNDTTNWRNWRNDNPPKNFEEDDSTVYVTGPYDSRFVFSGIFDGNGYVISGMYIYSPDNDYSTNSLFWSASGAVIQNVKIVASYIEGMGNVGSIAGTIFNGTVIKNCKFSGKLVGHNGSVGGLVGVAFRSEIINCSTTGHVIYDAIKFGEVGGLVGNSFASKIKKSFSTADIEAFGTAYASIGGLVGSGDGDPDSDVDNFVLENSYFSGSIKSTGYFCGGLVSYLYAPNSTIFSNCYSIGKIELANGICGGLIGKIDAPMKTNFMFQYSYYDNTVCSVPIGEYSKNASYNIEVKDLGRTTLEMKQKATYVDWDFNTIWDINPNKNNGYPFLRWQY